MDGIERPKSLTELVTETMRDWIISGRLELGSRLSEARLAKQLNVSRTPVREAVNRLEIEGLLCVEPQRGSFVFELQPDELAKLCDARVCLETAALRSALAHEPKGLSDKLHDIVERMRDARKRKDDSEYLALDTEFHQSILEFSGNVFLNDAYQAIAQKMAAIRNRLGRHPDHMAKSFDEHVGLLAAVDKGETEESVGILIKHIDRKEGSYWDLATQAEDPEPPNRR